MNTTLATVTLHRMHSVDNTALGYFVVFDHLFFTAEDAAKLLPAGEYECRIVQGLKSNLPAALDYAYQIAGIPGRNPFVFMTVGNDYTNANGHLVGGLQVDSEDGSVYKSGMAIVRFYNLMKLKIDLGPIKLIIIDPEQPK